MFGWSDRILRIDLSKQHASIETTKPYTEHFIGGRGINTKIIFDELEFIKFPFDAENRIIFGPGLLTGTPAPTAARMKVTTLTPIGRIASSGIGGYVGAEIRHAGYDNVIVQGKADKPVYIYIRDDLVEIKDASHLWGMDTQETQQTIKREVEDPDVQILCIGPAGENLVSFSCIMSGIFSSAGYGGFGAIMGSKNLKAVAVRGKRGIYLTNSKEFLRRSLEIRSKVQKNSGWQAMVSDGGKSTASSNVTSGAAVFGNWEQGEWDENIANKLASSGEIFWKQHAKGKVGCFGCPMHHFRIFDVPDIGIGAPKCSAWASFATPIWNTDYKLMYEIGYLCNLYGLDFVSTANVIAFLTELFSREILTKKDTGGIVFQRGDRIPIITMIEQIAKQDGFGKVMKNGVLDGARKIGKGSKKYAMHIKGVEMTQGEPRALPIVALAAAISKHPLDPIPLPGMQWEPQKSEPTPTIIDQKEENRVFQGENWSMVMDMLGLCKWFSMYQVSFLEDAVDLFFLATGKETSSETLLKAAERAWVLDRAANVIQGGSRNEDTLPHRILKDDIQSGPLKGNRVDEDQLKSMIDGYYKLRGLDKQGVPEELTFQKLDLTQELDVFQRRIANANQD